MKLLLTSSGISNASLANALKRLVKSPIKIAFIPTAANTVNEEKSWLINDLKNCKKLGSVDIVDISALPRAIWLPRLKKANVIFVGGGDTPYLMKCVVSSGLKNELPKLLEKRVYVGISAGSMVTNKTLQASTSFIFSKKKAPEGLGMVDFYIRPHLNAPEFRVKGINEKNLKKTASRFDGDVYAIDDDSGIVVDGGKIKIVSEGSWKLYRKSEVI